MSTAYEYGGIERTQPQWVSRRADGDTHPQSTDEREAHNQALDRSGNRAFTYDGTDREMVDWTHANQ